MKQAVLFDFGGVITTSPFDAFARYEKANGLPVGLVRDINSSNPDDNAWARLERNEVDRDGFARLFEAEAAERGYEVDGNAIIGLLSGDIRPEMVKAVKTIKEAGLKVACLTNNIRPHSEDPTVKKGAVEAMSLFDHVVESSVVGIRKPEVGFYTLALDALGVEPSEAVFLDDLGINLKPARQMGITTIKVLNADQALSELSDVLGIDLQ